MPTNINTKRDIFNFLKWFKRDEKNYKGQFAWGDFSREEIIAKEFFITKVIELFISPGNLKEDFAASWTFIATS